MPDIENNWDALFFEADSIFKEPNIAVNSKKLSILLRFLLSRYCTELHVSAAKQLAEQLEESGDCDLATVVDVFPDELAQPGDLDKGDFILRDGEYLEKARRIVTWTFQIPKLEENYSVIKELVREAFEARMSYGGNRVPELREISINSLDVSKLIVKQVEKQYRLEKLRRAQKT
jgi:hypothetical protein